MVNVGACVLPTSTTSGVSASLPSDVVRRSTRPSHSCSSMVSVEPGFCSSNSVVSQSRISWGVSVPLSQSRMSAGSGAAADSSADGKEAGSLPPVGSLQSVLGALTTVFSKEATTGTFRSRRLGHDPATTSAGLPDSTFTGGLRYDYAAISMAANGTATHARPARTANLRR